MSGFGSIDLIMPFGGFVFTNTFWRGSKSCISRGLSSLRSYTLLISYLILFLLFEKHFFVWRNISNSNLLNKKSSRQNPSSIEQEPVIYFDYNDFLKLFWWSKIILESFVLIPVMLVYANFSRSLCFKSYIETC